MAGTWHYGIPSRMGLFGTSSLYIYISLFGGVTLLVFLFCFCCQRKLQARTLAMADITDIEGQRSRARQGATRTQRRSDTHQLITSIITPPPDYATVIKKDSLVPTISEEPAPPTYEVAMAGLRSDGYVWSKIVFFQELMDILLDKYRKLNGWQHGNTNDLKKNHSKERKKKIVSQFFY